MSKPDLIIAAISGMTRWQICPFANSIVKSGFLEAGGEAVILASGVDAFTLDCLRQRDFTVVPFTNPPKSPTFVVKDRFEVLLKFLKKYGDEYRYVIWVDTNDLVFQLNPTPWLDRLPDGPVLIAASECWRVADETQFNAPWVKNTTPDDFEWLQYTSICCGGTIAGDVQTMIDAITSILALVTARPGANDQAALTYIAHKPFMFSPPTRVIIPRMQMGWAATCSAFSVLNFSSPIGISEDQLTDAPPTFDLEDETVFTPDGKTPMVIVHQYNRDVRWIKIMYEKYGDMRVDITEKGAMVFPKAAR
jgi:hypothetical protein